MNELGHEHDALRRSYLESLKGYTQIHSCKHCENIIIDLYAHRWRNWIMFHISRMLGSIARLTKRFVNSRWDGFWSRSWWMSQKTILTLNVDEAREGFAQRCWLHYVLFETTSNLQYRDSTVQIPLLFEYTRSTPNMKYSLNCIRLPKVEDLPKLDLSSYDKRLNICSTAPVAATTQNLAVRPPPNPSPASEYSFKLAQSWVKSCTTTHDLCQETEIMAMPKRLIQIEGPANGADWQIRLVTTSKREQYAALSYCWGDSQSQPSMTTDAVFEKELDFSKVGQTVRDAVTVTGNLGLEYLWVDAICIAQSDNAEKADEMSKMADIYPGSYIVISAARAATGWAGFLSPYKDDERVYMKVTVRRPDKKLEDVILYQPQGKSVEKSDFGPVMDRAWCLQEHILAPRMLIYTPYDLHFSCRTECRSDNINVLGAVEYFQPTLLSAIKRGGKSTRDAWQSVAAEFSTRSITIETDKLLAISAFALVCSKHLQSRYLAGIWTDKIPQQLA